MSTDETTGEALRRLLNRSGLPMRAVATAAGYSAASGIQRYVEPTYRKRLPADVADRFAKALAGKGSPPIRADEILSLTGVTALPPMNARVVAFEGEPLDSTSEDLPLWGSAIGTVRLFDGEAIEQTTLNTGDVVEYVKRPSILRGKAFAYALHIVGSSMEPALDDGEFVVAVKDAPLSTNDYVIVYLRDEDEDDGMRARGVLVKRLIRRSASFVELRQYEPAMTFRVPMEQVLRIDRVLTRREMLQ